MTRVRTPLGWAVVLGTLLACSPQPDPEDREAEGPDLPAASREPAAKAPREPPWFQEITEELRLEFRHDAGIDGAYYAPEIMGSGGALFDANGDGDLDLYLLNGRSLTTDREALPNRFFLQSEGVFEDTTEASGLGHRAFGMGTALGDMDNDGDMDLFLSNLGADVLYRNGGDGTFEDISTAAGIRGEGWSTSACFLDIDLDGFLDLYVASYFHFDPPKSCTDDAGKREYCGPESFRGLANLLYRNRGDGTFEDVSVATGIARVAGKSLGVACADFDGDGWTDIYVANDGEPNELWINQRDSTFEDRALLLGAGLNLFGKPEASMGLALGDTDGDLELDLFMTHLDRESNTFYANLGAAGFEDATARTGLGPDSLPFTGFGTAFFDADLDGDLDLLIANGKVRRGASVNEGSTERSADDSALAAQLVPYAESNLFYLNQGDGTFRGASDAAGQLGKRVEVSRALMLDDLDGDGDLDVVLTQGGGPVRVFRASPPSAGHWLRVRAVDPAWRRDALGAAVILEAGDFRAIRPINSTGSYLSAGEPEAHFGLGPRQEVDRLIVIWPGGAREAFPGGPADRRVLLRRGEGRPVESEDA